MVGATGSSSAVALLRLLGFPGPGGAAATPAKGDWAAIAAVAARTGLAPLLHRQLAESSGPELPPPDTLAALRSAYLRTLGVNLRAREQIAELVSALAAAGIPSALLKGAHLAHGVYEDPATRAMCDLDLLVATGRVADAAAVLRSLGYAPAADYGLAAELAHRAHLPPFLAPGRLPVELHWRLLRPTEPYRIDAAALLERARPLPALGPAARALDPADAFLHLALHAIVKDRLAGALRTLVDLRLLLAVTQGDESWRAAAARAREAGAARVHDLALALLASFAPGDPPQPLPGLAQARLEPAIVELARALALEAPEEGAGIAPNLARAFAGDPRAAFRLLLSRLFPTRSEMGALEPGPEGLTGLLRYPRRWVGLLSRHGPAAWRLLRRGEAERERASALERGRELAEWCAGVRATSLSPRRGRPPSPAPGPPRDP